MAATPPVVMRPQGIPDGTRRRTPASTKLLHEWFAVRYPSIVPMYELRLGPTAQVPLGQPLTPALEAALKVANWYADAVAVLPTELLVVEAKVLPNPGAVGQALWYSRLIPATAALKNWLNLPITPVVLFGLGDTQLTTWAASLGVRTEVYSPSWISDYIEGRYVTRRSAPSEVPITASSEG